MADALPSTLDERMRWAARLGTRAVRRVLADNRRRGIPSVFEFRGHVLYEQPDGTLRLPPSDAHAPPSAGATGSPPARR